MARQGASARRAEGGFTLLEIAIALGVFAVGMLGLTAMQLHAMRSGSSGRHASQAAAPSGTIRPVCRTSLSIRSAIARRLCCDSATWSITV